MKIAHCRNKNMARKQTSEENEKLTWQDRKCGEKLKNEENEKHTLQDLDCGEKIGKGGKCESHTVGPGIWREN